MRMRRWKALLSDSLVHIAVILSLLRTDLRVYLRQYSQHPEIQQALGQSVGLRLSDNYHSRNQPSYPSVKYIDDTDYLLNRINRLGQSSIFRHQTISAWLLTTDPTPQSSTSASSAGAAASTSSPVELSLQDVQLIEQLWKDDIECTQDQGAAMCFKSKEQNDVAAELITEEDSGIRVALPEPFPYAYSAESSSLYLPGGQDPQRTPQYNTQSSLETDLLDLNPLTQDAGLYQDETLTNSSMIQPDQYPGLDTNLWERNVSNNDTGVLWGMGEGLESAPISAINLTDDDFDDDMLEPSILESMDLLSSGMDIDFDLDAADNLLCDVTGSVSGDSAVSMGSSSPRNERHSISSDPFDLEDGASGYSEFKTEPFDNGFFDYESQSKASKYERNVVSHDHTYGAPHGGVPHVRKMDMKTPKVPSRGLAHDEVMCRKLKIPFTVETIINTPLDQFNSLIEKCKLTSKQATLVRDIRRRGKNKVAAQNCRQKKVGEFSDVEVEVNELRSRRAALHQKRTVLLGKTTSVRKHIDIMSAEIFSTLRDENGIPYDSSQFSLEVGSNGEIEVTSTERSSRRSRNSKKRDNSKHRRS